MGTGDSSHGIFISMFKLKNEKKKFSGTYSFGMGKQMEDYNLSNESEARER